MQLEVRERMLAAQVAGARHLVHWLLGTLAVVAPVLALVSARTGNRTLLVQLVQLSVVTAFEYDFAYGAKPKRIAAEAERIMRDERALLGLVDLLDRKVAAAAAVEAALARQVGARPV